MNSSPDAPFFSLVIPVYKVERFLPDALDSVREQTFTDYEVFCVDDGSPDGSGALLDEAARGDGRLRVIHQRNAGVSAARNRALDRVRGTYVLFLDPDDAICPGWFATFAKVIHAHHPDLVQFDYRYIEEADDWRTVSVPALEENRCQVATDALTCGELWGERFVSAGHPVTKAWRREVLSGKRFPVGVPFFEDRHFLWAAFSGVSSLVIADYPGYFYRKREGSALFSTEKRPLIRSVKVNIAEYQTILAVTRQMRGNVLRPFPIFYYAAFAWAAFLIKLRLRPKPETSIPLPQSPRLTAYIRNHRAGRPDSADCAIFWRVLLLRFFLLLEEVRLLLVRLKH